MEIQKYKATISGTSKKVVGYITETRKHLGYGVYKNETEYLISVTDKSMTNGDYGTFIVEKDSIIKFNQCLVCKIHEQKKEFGYFACSKKCYNKL